MTQQNIKEMAEKEYPLHNDPCSDPEQYLLRNAYSKGATDVLKTHVPLADVLKILEDCRLTSVKSKSHSGDYAENIIAHAIYEIDELIEP